jgi:hypothetical protein
MVREAKETLELYVLRPRSQAVGPPRPIQSHSTIAGHLPHSALELRIYETTTRYTTWSRSSRTLSRKTRHRWTVSLSGSRQGPTTMAPTIPARALTLMQTWYLRSRLAWGDVEHSITRQIRFVCLQNRLETDVCPASAVMDATDHEVLRRPSVGVPSCSHGISIGWGQYIPWPACIQKCRRCYTSCLTDILVQSSKHVASGWRRPRQRT